MIDIFKNKITLQKQYHHHCKIFFSFKMIVFKNTQLEATYRILIILFLSSMIIMVANGSPDKNSVLKKCQNMEDCPAGKICENYNSMKYSLDYIVDAEILMG